MTATGNTLVRASSSHTHKATGSSQLSQAFVFLRKENRKKTKNLHKQFLLTLCSPVRSLSLGPSPIPLTELEKRQRADNISIIPKKKKKGGGKEKKDNTHRLTQYMQSEALFVDDKAFYTWEEGN